LPEAISAGIYRAHRIPAAIRHRVPHAGSARDLNGFREGGDALRLKFVTYTRVAAGAAGKPPRLHQLDGATAEFLLEHVRSLIKKATRDDGAPAARFADPDAHQLFRRLYSGSAREFLEATHRLAERLTEAMDGRTSEGLLVALRTESEDAEIVAGVLKLQVASGHGAVLQRLESGELQLAAVTGMLESPSDLEKGALVAQSLKDGEVFCADRLSVKARYFPAALGIRRFAAAAPAAKAFFDTVQKVAPALVPRIAQAWPRVEPDHTREVLARLGEQVPELTPQLQEEVVEVLETYPEPVAWLDTRRKVKETYKVGGITLSGPIEEMRRQVGCARTAEGPWRLVIDCVDEPVPTHSASAVR
jgi:hypothetical protein